jgi:ribonuclease P protein component
LCKAVEFSAVLRFRRHASLDILQVYARPNQLNCSRLGLIVAKKVARRAVMRNRVKRLLREVFRMNMNQENLNTAGMDWVIRLRRPVNQQDSVILANEAKTLMLQLLQCQK